MTLACENIRFSSLFADGNFSRETSPAAKSEEKRMFSQAILTFISAEVSRKIALEKEKNKLRHHHLISMVCLRNRFHVAVRLFSNDKNIFQNSKPLLTMTHDRNCCRDFLQFKHHQVVKNSFCLRFFIFLLCKQLLLKFFEAFTCLIRNNLTNIFN